MDVTNILPQLERLDGEIDDLEEVLQPLLGSLSDVANKLPLLDKAKLYVLVTYALESMLFSSLRLNGVDAKEHPIFKELARVRQHFEKIKNIESPPPKPEQSLNKEAAIRFIKSGLAENQDKEMNAKLAEMIAKEKARAAIKAAQPGAKRKVGETESSSESVDASSGKDVEPEPATKKSKKSRKDKSKSRKQK